MEWIWNGKPKVKIYYFFGITSFFHFQLEQITQQAAQLAESKNFVINIDKSESVGQIEPIKAPIAPKQNTFSTQAALDLWVNWYVVKAVSQPHQATLAQQIISVARGQQVKLTESVTKKINRTVGFNVTTPVAVAASVNASVNYETSATYSTEITWNGPAESSTAISRNFYWTGFEDRGTWCGDGYGYPSNDYVNTYEGSYTEPVEYLQWSLDIY